MNKYFAAFFAVFLLLSLLFCFVAKTAQTGNIAPNNNGTHSLTENTAEYTKKFPKKSDGSADELRGVWLSCYELKTLCAGKSEKEYRTEIEKVLSVLCENSVNTVFFQVRGFCDALYFSNVFPMSEYVNSAYGEKTSFDPLGVFIECASKYGVAVHAWINPFRVSYNTDVKSLHAANPAAVLQKNGRDDLLIICSKGIYLNPADSCCLKLILDGIRELIEGYGIAGIHFDDYFYPECEFDDGEYYGEYKEAGGTLSVDDWRRENISDFVSSVFALVKSLDSNLQFGISPIASAQRCRTKLFADVEKWCCTPGYIDYIMPQIYFGFENEAAPFEKTALEWSEIAQNGAVRLYCGLAAYKCGKPDKNAGTGIDEWVVNSDILSRQYEYLKENGIYSGFCLFSYSYAFGKNTTDNSILELKKLSDMIQ